MVKKILLAVWIFGVAFLFVASKIRVIELGYEVSQLKEEIEKAKRMNGILKSKMAGRLSTSELVRLAKRFQMRAPESAQVFFIQE